MKKLLTTISTITLSLSLLLTPILTSPTLASEVTLSPQVSSLNSNTISQTASTKTVKPTKVTLNKKTTTINIGSTETLTPTIFPSTATNQNVTWKSSNVKIATVDSDGTVTGIKKGRVIITVTTVDGKKTAKCRVTVKTIPIINVTSINLNEENISMNVGDSDILTATITPDNATNQSVTWSSSDESIVTVNSEGEIGGISSGDATITATTKDGNKKATCRVTVKSVPIPIITSISDIEQTINQGDDYSLPETIEVMMSDNTTQQLPATWNPSEVDTSKSGTYEFYGKVIGWDEEVKLTLTVISSDPIISISSITTVNITTTVGEVPILPYEVIATMSDGTTKNVNVTWVTPTANQYASVGTFTVSGTITESTTIKAVANVTVINSEPTISSIADIYQTINQNDSYSPPTTVEATMSDNSKKQVGITWNIPNLSSLSSTSIINDNDLTNDFNKESLESLKSLTKSNSIFNVKEKEKMENKIKEEKSDFENSLDVNETRTQLLSTLAIDTSKSGVFTFYGNVDGYNKQVKLTLTIKAISYVKFFPLLSDVPMPVGYDYKKVSVTSSGTVFYYYDMNAFSYYSFSESIKPYGWTYYKTDFDYQGYSIFYFRKGNSLIGMAWIGYDRVIYGKIR